MIDPQLPWEPSAAPSQPARTAPLRRPPTELAVAVIVLAWVWVAWLVVLGFAGDASEETWRVAVDRGLSYDDTDPTVFDAAYLPVRLYLVAVLVVASLWLHQSRRFAEALGVGHRFRLSIVWTWLGWVVPLLQLWFPALAVSDVWRATLRRRLGWVLLPWWGCWLVMLWLSWTAEGWRGGVLGGDVLQDEVLVVSESYVFAAILAAISCWAWTVIVLRVRRAQLDLASAEFGAPPTSNDVGRRR
ncbi:DUF4328 domain-containing protein [Promicromonospora sp. NPDC060204]|uniref:DUF4328 domain-containing protein n=1 Tax=Promicromonospora sp. NPDC060204 TaxID=3347071 RepID=UPI00366A1604